LGLAVLLIVDADPSFLELAQQQLVDGFREVLFAGTATHAIELLRAVGMEVSAAVINVRLPKPQNGISLIQELHQDYPGLPIVAVTAQGDVKEVKRAKAAGAAEVLQKPITEEWRSVIKQVRNRPAPGDQV
jgi:DNA-binding NtrC family response regulator